MKTPAVATALPSKKTEPVYEAAHFFGPDDWPSRIGQEQPVPYLSEEWTKAIQKLTQP